MKIRPKDKKATIMLRVIKGALVPADLTSAGMLRDRNYNIGDVLSAELKKPRNPKFHRMAHALGQALIENTDDFAEYTDAHKVLKRLQIEANIGCDVMAIKVPGIGMLEHRTPQSLSFENMDEAEFQAVYAALCNYVIKHYWRDMEADQIEQMASLVGMAA
jgi:hypothetical protein